jgi:hypothetical protein
MGKLTIALAALALSGCAAVDNYAESVKDSPLFSTRAELEARDAERCQRFGAVPGSDAFVLCMGQLQQARATRAAAK